MTSSTAANQSASQEKIFETFRALEIWLNQPPREDSAVTIPQLLKLAKAAAILMYGGKAMRNSPPVSMEQAILIGDLLRQEELLPVDPSLKFSLIRANRGPIPPQAFQAATVRVQKMTAQHALQPAA